MKHTAYGYSRPAAHNIGNVVGSYFLFYYCCATLAFFQVLVQFFVLVVQGFYLTVTYFRHFAVITIAFRFISFEFQLLYRGFVALNLGNYFLFRVPFRAIIGSLFFYFGYFLVELRKFCIILLAFYGFTLYFQLFFLSCQLVKLFGHGITLYSEFGCGFVHKVYGFVRKETVGNITIREFHGCNNGIVLNTHVMMVFVFLFYASQNGY